MSMIPWLWSPSTVILEPKKRKYVTTSTFSPSICHEVMGLDAMILVFSWYLVLSLLFPSLPSPSSRGSLIPLHFLPLGCYHLHIWGCWSFSHLSWFQLVTHPAWAFLMMLSVYRLSKQGGSRQPSCTSFSILN